MLIFFFPKFFCQNYFLRFSRAEIEAENNSNEDEEVIDPITIAVIAGASLSGQHHRESNLKSIIALYSINLS